MVSEKKRSWFWEQVRKGVCTPDDWEDFEDMFGGRCFYPYTLRDFLDFVKSRQ